MYGVIDIPLVKDRDAAKHSIIPRTASTMKTYLRLTIVSHFKTLSQGYINLCISLKLIIVETFSFHCMQIFSIKIKDPKPHIASH